MGGNHAAGSGAGQPQNPRDAAANLAAALSEGTAKPGGSRDHLVADTAVPLVGAVIRALENHQQDPDRGLRIDRGLPGHCLGQAAGLALALPATHVFCLTGTDEALGGRTLEAARFAARKAIRNLMLIALGPPPADMNPAVLYAALGWQAAQSAGSGDSLARALSGCRRAPAPSVVFVNTSPEGGAAL